MSTSKRKKEQRAAELREQSILAKYHARKKPPVAREFGKYVPTESYRRDTPEYQSLKTLECNTARKEDLYYTGDYLTGIATSHKSNLIPVSKNIDPAEYAQMRR